MLLPSRAFRKFGNERFELVPIPNHWNVGLPSVRRHSPRQMLQNKFAERAQEGGKP